MRLNRLFVGVILIIAAIVPTAVLAIGDPIGAGTVPPSSLGGGLIRRPGLVGAGGAVTPSSTGAFQLHGITPYGRGSYMMNVPPSSLSGNVQIATPSQYFGQYRGTAPSSYFNLYNTGTAIPGSPGTVWPSSAPISGQATQGFSVFTPPAGRILVNPQMAISNTQFRAMRFSTQELESLVLDGVASQAQAQRLVNPANIGQMQRLQLDLERLKYRAAPLRQSMIVRDESLRPLSGVTQDTGAVGTSDLAAMRQQAPQTTLTDTYRAKAVSAKVPESDVASQRPAAPASAAKPKADSKSPPKTEADKARVAGSHIELAEKYMKDGKFYWAADAYTLAAIYEPGDARAYAGRSHALFAAGEYVGSAAALALALTVSPEAAGREVDLAELLGGKDKAESRVVELARIVEKSDSAELRFLLAYAYHQLKRGVLAAETIKIVQEKAPQVPAVKALKAAIEAKK